MSKSRIIQIIEEAYMYIIEDLKNEHSRYQKLRTEGKIIANKYIIISGLEHKI